MKHALVAMPHNAGERLDVFLARRLPDESRAFLQSLIRSGAATVNGKRSKPRYHICASDRIVIEIPKKQHALVPASNLQIPIIYEDTEMLVINKPPGIPTHPPAISGTGTVANWLLGHYPGIEGVGESPLRPGIVHRLDKGTSGIMVIAKTQKMFEYLKGLFKTREIKKEYLAILEGKPPAPEGVVEGYLAPGKKDYRIKKFQALPSSKKAKLSRSRFKVVRYIGGATLVKFFPETGRTHQIRVHARTLGTPVLGDMLYGAKMKLPDEFRGRFFLHASRISFSLPGGAKKSFSAPQPEDFEKVLAWLDKHRVLR